MAAIDRPTLRMIVLHGDEMGGFSPAARMMEDRGHHVTTTAHLNEAISALTTDTVDLMVIDLSATARPPVIEAMMELAATSHPRQVAIFADRSDDRLRSVREKLLPSRVSVLLRPLHLHRLLTILRKLENRSNLLAGA